MKKVLHTYVKAVDIMNIGVKAFCLLLFNICLYVLFANIFGRKLGLFSFTWSEEFGSFCIFYLIMCGSALAARHDMLIRVDMQALMDLLKRSRFGRQLVPWISTLSSIFFYVVVIYSAMLMMKIQGSALSPALHVAKRYFYLAMPIGCSLLILNTLASTFETLYLRGGNTPEDEMGKEMG